MTSGMDQSVLQIGGTAAKVLDAQRAATAAGANRFEAAAGAVLAAFLLVRQHPAGSAAAVVWMRDLVDRLDAHQTAGTSGLMTSMARQALESPSWRWVEPGQAPANDRD